MGNFKFLALLAVIRHMMQAQKKSRRRSSKALLLEDLHSRIRRSNLVLNMNFLRLGLAMIGRVRRFWVIERPQHWFETVWNSQLMAGCDDYWRQEFRFSKGTFMEIIRVVRPYLEKQNTNFRRAIPIEGRVAIAVWRLSTGNSYRSVASTFGCGKSTAIEITRDFCKIITRLSPRYIKFPQTPEETARAIQSFKEICKIPQALAAVDATHIAITAPNSPSKVDYYSRKQRYTINTQAVADDSLMFLDVSTGYPGSIHDARVMRNSSLFRKANRGDILSHPTKLVGQNIVRPLILGDGAYPLCDWLVKPFS